MKKPRILILILYLLLIEGMLLPVVLSMQEVIVGEKGFLMSLSDMISSQFGLALMISVVMIRSILWVMPLFLIFILVIDRIRIRSIFFVAILNVVSNVLIIVAYSISLFSGLITLPATQDAIVVAFISPFIINILPFSRGHVQTFINGTPK